LSLGVERATTLLISKCGVERRVEEAALSRFSTPRLESLGYVVLGVAEAA